MSTLDWPRCRVAGCAGRSAAPSGTCVAHLRADRFDRFRAALRPGSDLDLRGVTVPAPALEALLAALRGPDGRPHLGRARLDRAVLPAGTSFADACFEGDASFDGTAFTGPASFYGARFLGHVSFHGARFSGNVTFHTARFHRHASFEEAVFGGDALFGETRWYADAGLDHAAFTGAAEFDRARFDRDLALRGARITGPASFRRMRVGRNARFDRARFRRGARLGPLSVMGALQLDGLTAHEGLHVTAAVPLLSARGACVRGRGEFRVRSAALDLTGTSFAGTLDVREAARPFAGLDEPPAAPVRLLSLRDTRAPRIALADVDLSRCGLLGVSGELSLTGRCNFPVLRPRLAPWRASAVLADDPGPRPDPALADLYARLAAATSGRTSRDLRYRALQARRRGASGGWHRAGLAALWLTCGYGHRTGRAVLWLAMFAALALTGAARHGTPARTHPAPSRAVPSPARR
ncbi:pentapeptide repeat-containing protein [Actinomadura rubteroloni]|uniref:pentapeptide repeat-containing protein n=1 Tax=Actinomadura rubteroloni TaxID=1926885 RepID=UPI0011B01CF4|nr:pentapeptide repeat-containing protein [Actinomadura rubteroloni]